VRSPVSHRSTASMPVSVRPTKAEGLKFRGNAQKTLSAALAQKFPADGHAPAQFLPNCERPNVFPTVLKILEQTMSTRGS